MRVVEPPFSVPGFRVGHWTEATGQTGCTVVIADRLVPAVAEVRGGAPGTRELGLLHEGALVQRVDAVLLTGGSAYGLSAADGVVRWLRERGRGYPTGVVPVPIVTAAVLFDLRRADSPRPDPAAGYQAAAAADPMGWVAGRVGAGAGATVGKVAGRDRAVAAGLGAAKVETPLGAVAALVAVNAVGDIVDPNTGTILAGTMDEERRSWADSRGLLLGGLPTDPLEHANTTIAVIATDIPADRRALTRMAIAAHDGLARAVRPAHTLFDGDTVFVLSSREGESSPQEILVMAAAAEIAMEQAIVRAALAARRSGRGVPE